MHGVLVKVSLSVTCYLVQGSRFQRAPISDYRHLHGVFLRAVISPCEPNTCETTATVSLASCAARLSLPGGSPRAHTPLHRLVEDYNTDGSTVLLRPSAPVYCIDLGPAALGGVGTHTAQTAAAAGGQGAPEPALPGFAGPEVNLEASGGVAGIGSRCGYRAYGFGPPQHSYASNSTSSSGHSSSQPPQQVSPAGVRGDATAVPALRLRLPPSAAPAGERVAACTVHRTGTVCWLYSWQPLTYVHDHPLLLTWPSPSVHVVSGWPCLL
jgi:hypothetical protein